MWHVGSGGSGSRGGGGVDVKFLTFSGGRDGVTKIEHLRRRGKGSKFRSLSYSKTRATSRLFSV